MPPSDVYKKAEIAFHEGNAKAALALCERVPATSPDALNAAALAAECLAELGRWDEADARAGVVLQEDDRWATGHLIRGLTAIERRRWREAAESLEAAFDADDSLAEAAIARAAVADFKGDAKGADRWLAAARRADPDFPGPTRVGADDFDALLLDVLEGFPAKTTATLEESRFRVVPMPTDADLKHGTALTAAGRIDELDPENDPPTVGVTFYQRNLEREAGAIDDIADAMEEVVETALAALTKAVKALKD